MNSCLGRWRTLACWKRTLSYGHSGKSKIDRASFFTDTLSIFRTMRRFERVSAYFVLISGFVRPRRRTSRPRSPLSRAYPTRSTTWAVILSAHDRGNRGRQRGEGLILLFQPLLFPSQEGNKPKIRLALLCYLRVLHYIHSAIAESLMNNTRGVLSTPHDRCPILFSRIGFVQFSQLINSAIKEGIPYIPGIRVIYIAPFFVLHHVNGFSVIALGDVNYIPRDPFRWDSNFFKFLEAGFAHLQSSSSPYPYTVFSCPQYGQVT